jgi:hypothetical protein
MNSSVRAEATPVDQAGGSSVDIQIQRINSTQDLERALGVDAEASYGCASFGPSMSARFSFSEQSKVQASSLFMTVTIRVQLEFLSIDSPHLTDEAAKASANPQVFEARYGNMFVRGIGRGGLFVGVLRVDTGSTEESMKISAELSGSYGLFDMEAKSKFSELQKTYKNEVFIRQYQEGGPKNLTITDPSDPYRLIENAKAFLESFNVDKEAVAAVAVPFFVTLAPTTIAEGPIPPDSAEIQKAQDVLVACARKRSALLDDLNLLEYVAENHNKFTFTDTVPLPVIQEAITKHQDDLMLIADCASSAIRNRATATYPEQFAKDKGAVYPTSSMPAPMPVFVAPARQVMVPSFSDCADPAACDARAQQNELITSYVTEGEFPGPVQFKVIRTEPAAGTMVDVGSTIKIFHPAQKIIMLEAIGLADLSGIKLPGGG